MGKELNMKEGVRGHVIGIWVSAEDQDSHLWVEACLSASSFGAIWLRFESHFNDQWFGQNWKLQGAEKLREHDFLTKSF